jgi:tRNA 2-thiocytidine biosynthesis protein TtcA
VDGAVVDSGELRRIERRLLKVTGQAIGDFDLVEDGDRLLVGLSGGKDSAVLLMVLQLLQKRAPIRFEIEAVNLDPGYDTYQPEVVQQFAESRGVKIHMIQAPIRELIETKLAPGDIACPLCSRMRRGALYTLANKIGCNKLVLGHHLDDAAETLLMNLFYSGSLRAMPPRLVREDGPPQVIRPLCYALERDISAYAAGCQVPIVPCASPSCGTGDQRRQSIKRMLSELEKTHPDLKNQMRKALKNVDVRYLFVKSPRD